MLPDTKLGDNKNKVGETVLNYLKNIRNSEVEETERRKQMVKVESSKSVGLRDLEVDDNCRSWYEESDTDPNDIEHT